MSTFPPTPAPSTEISGKPNAVATSFESIKLPPAAISSSRSSVSSVDGSSDSSYRPGAAAAASNSRKRSSTVAGLEENKSKATRDDYELPPPPTRSRKIIQMKPQAGRQQKQQQQSKQSYPESTVQSPEDKASPHAAATTSAGKRRQAAATTAAGRKIARKTAHSLIERRRRSKMNEEFGVLKDMIPACTGQEMHKLAILQASIEYMRYLESCVSELKAAHKNCKAHDGRPSSARLSLSVDIASRSSSTSDDSDRVDDDEEDGSEVEGELGASAAVPTHSALPIEHYPHTIPTASNAWSSTSPAINPSCASSPLYSRPSTGTLVPPSSLPSPVFSAHHHRDLPRLPIPNLSSPSFTARDGDNLCSLAPLGGSGGGGGAAAAATAAAAGGRRDIEDHEAFTASALLMLNTDRRSWAGRVLSVKDLLSSQ